MVDFESARAVADAVLYEGYLLYPYRRSSGKNRVRWRFGVLAPRRWLEHSGVVGTSVTGSADAWYQQIECLLQAPDSATIHMRLRFLQFQHRSVEARGSADTDGDFQPCDVLDVCRRRYLMTFDEAVPREFHIVVPLGELRSAGHTATIGVPGGEDVEALGDQGRLVRRWALSATVRIAITATGAPFPLYRLPLTIENTADWTATDVPRARGAQHHWLVLIDDCLRLVAAVRQTWKGLSGGNQAWPEIERFFAELVEQR